MSFDLETIYALLPAIYRVRDAAIAEQSADLLTGAERDELAALRAAALSLTPAQQERLHALEELRLRGPLKSLLLVIAEQVAALEENLAQLYDDQFIETCAPWAVPYIGELVGYRAPPPEVAGGLGSPRAEVANTIAFRRRKGTAAMLEQLARDVSDCDAAVVELFARLATTQYLNHLRPESRATLDLRRVGELEQLGTPFERAAHSAEVRRIGSRRGRYNIPNIGVFLYRVRSLGLVDSPAFAVDDRRFMFSPLGANLPLFNRPVAEARITQLAGPANVPLPIGRRQLRARLDELYGEGLSLWIRVGELLVAPDEVEACDLSDLDADPQTSAWAHMGQDLIAIDPLLGRLVFPTPPAGPVLVSFSYGSGGPLGGGNYERATSLSERLAPVVRVPAVQPTVAAAVGAVAAGGAAEIVGDGRYDAPATLRVDANRVLELRAADRSRPLLELTGELELGGGEGGELILNGLLIAGGPLVVPASLGGQPNRLQRLTLRHCTLVPGHALGRDGAPISAEASLRVEIPDLTLTIERCIVGGLRVDEGSQATIDESIVDAGGPAAVAYAALDGAGPGGRLELRSSTLIGKLHTAALSLAENSILHAELGAGDGWAAPVRAERRQEGCVRFCYLPLASIVPRRFSCVPRDAAEAEGLRPQFVSLRYGEPGYGLLHPSCAAAIGRGAEDEGELGAFRIRGLPQREALLTGRLDEYLRFGLEAGIFYAS